MSDVLFLQFMSEFFYRLWNTPYENYLNNTNVIDLSFEFPFFGKKFTTIDIGQGLPKVEMKSLLTPGSNSTNLNAYGAIHLFQHDWSLFHGAALGTTVTIKIYESTHFIMIKWLNLKMNNEDFGSMSLYLDHTGTF